MTKDTLYIAVTALTDGFRRAGRAWSTTPTIVPTADFTAEQLEALEADPAIVISPADAPDGEAEAALIAAISQLDPDDPEHFTDSGKPQVKALEAILGHDLSAAARDAAWDAFEQARAA